MTKPVPQGLEGYNLDADTPLIVDGERKLGVWHTGLVYAQAAWSAKSDSGRHVRYRLIGGLLGYAATLQVLDEFNYRRGLQPLQIQPQATSYVESKQRLVSAETKQRRDAL